MKSLGIVIPIATYCETLLSTLQSLSQQSIKIELAIFNVSGDERVKTAISPYSNLIKFYHEGPDGGQAKAIQIGWEALDTDIVGWLNYDDYLAPNCINEALAQFDTPETVLVFGNSGIVDEAGNLRGMHPAVEDNNLARLETDCMISQPSCFVRYSAVKAVGGINPKLEYTMDWDLWLRLYKSYPNGTRYCKSLLSMVTFGNSTKTSQISIRRSFEIASIISQSQKITTALFITLKVNFWNFKNFYRGSFLDSNQFYMPKDKSLLLWEYTEESAQGIELNMTQSTPPPTIKLQVGGAESELHPVSSQNSVVHKYKFNHLEKRNQVFKLILDDKLEPTSLRAISFF